MNTYIFIGSSWIVAISLFLYVLHIRRSSKFKLREVYVTLALKTHITSANTSLILEADDKGVIISIDESIKIIGSTLSSDLVGKKLDVINTRLDDGGSDVLWSTLIQEKKPYGFTISGKYNTNSSFLFLLTLLPVLDMDDTIVGFVGVRTEDQPARASNDAQAQANVLARSHAHAEAILASIADGVLVTDQHGDITMINQAGREMLGVDKGEGVSVLELIPLEDEKGILILPDYHPIYQAIRGHGSVTTKKYTYVRADFTKLWLAITTAPIVFEGNVEGVVTVLRDATLEKQIDRSKTEFVSLASHQLRTPLTAINWYTELLLDAGTEKLSGDQVSFINQIRESSGRMNELVSSLLNVSRLELGTFTVEPVKTDISTLLSSVIAEQQPKIVERKHTVNIDTDENLEQVAVDGNLMRIILQNLISNAVKYTREEGTIEIHLYRHYPDMRLEVKDNGYGIPQNQHEQIFTKLFRADNVVEENLEGNGLGLYIVKSILEQTGGDIWFESELNKGTTFHVSIPLTGMRKKEGTKTLI